MIPIKHKLRKKELTILSEFLSASYEDANPMNLTQTHGFLCSIVSAPTLMMPSQWQPVLLGGHPNFESMVEAEQIIGLITAFYNNTIQQFLLPDNFECLLWEDNQCSDLSTCKDVTLKQWCEGYLAGARLDSEWRRDVKAVARLFPFGVLANELSLVGEKDADGNIIQDDMFYKEQFRRSLDRFVIENYEYWEDARKMSASGSMSRPYRRAQPKINRNAPCPCGSGKKYKKCCEGNQPASLQ